MCLNVENVKDMMLCKEPFERKVDGRLRDSGLVDRRDVCVVVMKRKKKITILYSFHHFGKRM